MAEQDNKLSEVDYLNKIKVVVDRHTENLRNILLMMKSGHWISAYNQIGGSEEGLKYLQKLLADRIQNIS
jgi:hypothetical protein